MQWVNTIRWLHHDEQRRAFAGMGEEKWSLYMRRLKQIIAIEDANVRTCACNRCGGNCPGKFRGSSSQIVCYDCTFGIHRGKSVRPDVTAETERKNGRSKGAEEPTPGQQSVQNVARRSHLRARRRKPLKKNRR